MAIKTYANSTSNSIKELIQVNEQLECHVKGCAKHRHGLNRQCSAHARAKMYYGDPLGSKVRPQHYRAERFKAEHIITNNWDHELIQKGVSYMQNWMDQVRAGTPGVQAAEIMGLQVDEGVQGWELFREAVAITLYNDRNPGVISDAKPEAFQIALCLAVLCYRNLPKLGVRHRNHLNVSIANRKNVGATIWYDLGRILVEISSAARDYDRKWDHETGAARTLVINS